MGFSEISMKAPNKKFIMIFSIQIHIKEHKIRKSIEKLQPKLIKTICLPVFWLPCAATCKNGDILREEGKL
jgi:hypothetical protein